MRLGLAWAAVTIIAAVVGAPALAAVLGVAALGAAGQAARSWRRAKGRAPFRPVAIAGAALVALAGAGGPLAVGGAAALVGVAAFASGQLRLGGRRRDGVLTAAIALLIGAGTAAPSVVLQRLGFVPVLVLLAAVHVFDASVYLVATGSRRWEGIVAGIAAVAALSLFAAAMLVPPFRGASPWALFAVLAVTLPAGALVASLVLPSASEPVPALRRVDTLLVAAPVWLLVAALTLAV